VVERRPVAGAPQRPPHRGSVWGTHLVHVESLGLVTVRD
jgi:hypothetical protein